MLWNEGLREASGGGDLGQMMGWSRVLNDAAVWRAFEASREADIGRNLQGNIFITLTFFDAADNTDYYFSTRKAFYDKF